MRLAGVRTVLHIAEVNETEKDILKKLGFLDLQETDMADNEMWEYCTDFYVSKKIDYHLTVMKSLILSVPGSRKFILMDSPGVWMLLYLEKLQNIRYTV